MSVFDLSAGDKAKIIKISAEGSVAARLLSLGIAVGKEIEVLSFSLFKSSVLIGCGAVRLGLRKNLALLLGVEKCE